MKIDLTKLHSFLSKRKQFIVALLALSCIWPLQFISKLNFNTDLTAIDASWMLALSNAWDQGLVWGDDIIFTYGPLSFLSTRVILHNSAWVLMLFDVYVACSFIWIISKVISAGFSWKKSALILLACFFYKQAMLLSLVFTLQFMAILYLNQYRHERKHLYVLQAIVLTTLIFYIKLNLAFVSIVIFVMYIFYLKALKTISWNAATASALVLILTIYLSSLLLPIHIGKYISTGILLITSYGDAVYIYPRTLLEKVLAGITLTLFISGVFYILKELKNHASAQKIIGLIFLVLLFVVFKQSYVRADLEHLKDFFYCAPVCMLVFMYVSGARLQFIHMPFGLTWLIVIGLLFRFQDYYYPIKKAAAFPAYFYSMANQPDYYEQAENRMIPEFIKEQMVGHTADIIPWETSVIILNKLHYNPRPVIQSYQAYNETLDGINAAHYSFYNAPEFVLYSVNSIDQHYHFFDDTQLKKMLYTGYYAMDTFTCRNEKIIVFKRSNIKDQKEFRKVSCGKVGINNSIIVPQSKYPLMIKIKMKCNLVGQLQKAVLRTPCSEIEMILQDSLSVRFQAATSILEGAYLLTDILIILKMLKHTLADILLPLRQLPGLKCM